MSFRLQLKQAMRRAWETNDAQRIASAIRSAAQDYGECLRQAWEDGSISRDEIRDCLEETKYRQNVKSVWMSA